MCGDLKHLAYVVYNDVRLRDSKSEVTARLATLNYVMPIQVIS